MTITDLYDLVLVIEKKNSEFRGLILKSETQKVCFLYEIRNAIRIISTIAIALALWIGVEIFFHHDIFYK